MLYIYQSSDVLVLKRKLAEVLAARRGLGVLESDRVVVNHFGVAEWLKTSLCEDLNIVANLAFSLPSSSVWELCSLVSGTAAKSFFKADYFKWRILEALPQLTEREGFEFLERYLVGGGRERKLYQLSASLAYLFEQYLIYRPEWIMHWESERDGYLRQQVSADGAYIQRVLPASVASDRDFCWQGYLWRNYLSPQDLSPQALLESVDNTVRDDGADDFKNSSENGGKEPQVHLVELLYRATTRLTSEVADFQGIDPVGEPTRGKMALLPKRLFLFGLHFLPPEYLRFYQVLSKHCEVYCFLHNPSSEYWGDIVTETYLARKNMEHLQEDRDLELSHYSTTNKLFSFLAQGAKSFFESIVELDTMAIVESLPEMYDGTDGAVALEADRGTADRSRDNAWHSDEVGIRDNNEDGVDVVQRCAQQGGHLNTHLNTLPDTLLNTLKHDLRDLVAEYDPTNRVIPADDWSIQIHNCYNERRELQTLKDSLLQILDNNRDIEPCDIVVMTGDITRYEPFIADVFDNMGDGMISNLSDNLSDNEDGVRRLPWSVVNSPLAERSNVIKVFFELLNIPHSDFAPSQMLSLLQIEFIRKRCYLAETDIMRIEELVERLEICWGLDKEGGESQGLDKLPANTWLFGLERILAGFATGASYQPDTDIAPLERVDTELLAVAGGLYVLVERLLKYQSAFSQSYSAQGWRKLLTEVVDDLFALAPVKETNVIRQLIEEQFTEIVEAEFAGELPLVMVQEALRAKSAALLAGGGGHGILFSTMLPLRGIPFKVVCFLGMEDESFPRHDSWQSYDMLVRYPKPGDRNTRGDDLFLFLQSIFAAGNFLYISFVGRDMHTDEHYLPSICVRALLDYCDEAFSLASGEKPSSLLLRCHKLLPIASDYFTARDDRLFTYSKSNEFLIRNCSRPALQSAKGDISSPEESYSVARHWSTSRRESSSTTAASDELPASRILSVSLLELERFFSHPQRYFFRHAQHIRLQNPLRMNDMEPVGIGGAAYRKLFEFLMPMLRDGCDEALCFKIASRRGLLPWGGRGEVYFARRCNVIREILAIGSTGQLLSVPCELELNLAESNAAESDCVAAERPLMVCLRGNIDVIVRDAATTLVGGNTGVNGVELFSTAPFSLDPPQLHHWLRHLVLCAVSNQREMSGLQLVRSVECGVTIREGAEKIESQMYNILTPTEAVHHIQHLIGLFLAGQEAPLPFIRQLSYQVFQGKADLGYLWDDFRLGGDLVARPSPYLHLAFPLDSPTPEDAGFDRDEFSRIAFGVYAPLSKATSKPSSKSISQTTSQPIRQSGSAQC